MESSSWSSSAYIFIVAGIMTMRTNWRLHGKYIMGTLYIYIYNVLGHSFKQYIYIYISYLYTYILYIILYVYIYIYIYMYTCILCMRRDGRVRWAPRPMWGHIVTAFLVSNAAKVTILIFTHPSGDTTQCRNCLFCANSRQ